MPHNIQTKDVLGLRSDDLDSHSWRKPAHHGLWHVGGDDAKTKPTQDYLRNKAKFTTRFIVIADAKTKPTLGYLRKANKSMFESSISNLFKSNFVWVFVSLTIKQETKNKYSNIIIIFLFSPKYGSLQNFMEKTWNKNPFQAHVN